ncbi:adenylate/guanylate cyclase domain-containing protein [uncultured Treponema sp.]|uniref:adenylate/guanylate cyclase domain-containing protein n=1 Tax=uncultured Treponema sp. TaxID=162155 RepID=UPI0025D9CCBA|nr:adenylate/guanylate cyclase domain-containing protein [uncultured Treponema sp.]
MTKRKTFAFLIPLVCVAASSLLLFTNLEAKFSDLFQRFLPSTQIRNDVLMVGIDDFAIETIDSFPFTRDVYADCISIMEEMGAQSIVFDLSFIDKARKSVNEKDEIFSPDEEMEKALKKSDITFLNFTLDYTSDIDEESKNILDQKGLLPNAEIKNDKVTEEYTGVVPTLPIFIEHAKAAGFVNADPDSDNYYRRVNLIAKYDDQYYMQLTLPALLQKLGNPKIIVENRKITLKNAKIDGKTKDLQIPRGNDGKFILKYPKMQFNEYNYLSLGDIYRIAQLKRAMAEEGEAEHIEEYTNLCAEVRPKLASAICIIGTCATSTSDYGVNPYESQYPLPGVHYTIINQILNGDFTSEIPPYISIIYALILTTLLVLAAKKMKSTVGKVIIGLIMIFVGTGILLAYYIITRTFVGETVPLFSSILAYISVIVLGFLTASKDKKFITNAFSQCLSKDVVNQIVANPDSFKLGGENREMTAIFTDIQKFSSFSELLTASELVALLNYYLTKMSDIIMAEGGTIDKYEGDAIIALVGAPLKMDDHATRAVKAALKMKAAEKVMNQEIRNIANGPQPVGMSDSLYSAFKIMVQNRKEIFTRIGINSGEMIAGYMGSENKKNYTMMGNNVNLASRLEGVNKQYSTFGILVSEATYKQLGEEILCRRLDKVQVVNVTTPLTLYEPLSLKAEASENLLEYVAVWEKAMQNFDREEYAEAHDKFCKLAVANSDDKVAAYYVKLLEDFFLKGRAPSEEDGFGVVYNPKLHCFRLLSK